MAEKLTRGKDTETMRERKIRRKIRGRGQKSFRFGEDLIKSESEDWSVSTHPCIDLTWTVSTHPIVLSQVLGQADQCVHYLLLLSFRPGKGKGGSSSNPPTLQPINIPTLQSYNAPIYQYAPTLQHSNPPICSNLSALQLSNLSTFQPSNPLTLRFSNASTPIVSNPPTLQPSNPPTLQLPTLQPSKPTV
ncbi:hypothetical protein RRG08_018384 [Elysia crispata]|uniref:Uncharacterized protein n=1 Tax=Elysia crispata TaxID=231223 RepID=A0AAE1D1S0_9GAST|nr:hypothetical protein RRG08_018384 [Elysia crispata]